MTYPHRRTLDESGFTLIELMIVMVVLGILAGIVLFGVGTFKSDAESSRDNANDHQCAVAIAAYQASHDGNDPTAFNQITSYFRSPPAGNCGL